MNRPNSTWIAIAAVIGLILLLFIVFRNADSDTTADLFEPLTQPKDTLEEVTQDPFEFIGRQVAFTSVINRVYSDRVFTIDTPGILNKDLLVVTKSSEIIIPQIKDTYQIIGTVKQFTGLEKIEAELNLNLQEEMITQYEQSIYILADSIQQIEQ